MNKFSSLSTSVLLALLTSSAAVSAYANGTESFSSRTSARSSNDSGESNPVRIGSTDRVRNPEEDFEPDSLPSINGSANKSLLNGDIVFEADRGTYVAVTKAHPNFEPLDNKLSAPNANSMLDSSSQEATSLENKGALAMDRCEHNINLALTQEPSMSSRSMSEKAQSFTSTFSARNNSVDEPRSLYVAFDHPKELQESYVVANDTTVISYSSDKSNFMITLKITPLKEEQPLTYEDFKQHLIKRFSDKENLLFGEYEVLQEIKSTQEALELYQQGNHSVFASPIDPDDHYMELTLRAFLKKGADGMLPDMQNFFYERSIVSHDYIATLSCELLGRQAQASVVKQQFESISPLCERILDSYRFSFSN